MKKKKVLCLGIVLVLTMSLFGAMRASGDGVLYVTGDVYAGSAVGDATTNNSYAFATAIYVNLSTGGNIGPNGTANLPQLNDTINAVVGGNPAYFLYDVGSGWDWEPCVPDTQAEVMVVLETVYGVNGWTGVNATTSTNRTLSCAAVDLFPDSRMRLFPTLSSVSGTNWINVTWNGMYEDTGIANIAHYDVYRSNVPTGPWTTPIGSSTAQAAGGNVYYNDTGLAAGTYYYRIGVNYSRGLSTYSTQGKSELLTAATVGIDILTVSGTPIASGTVAAGQPNVVMEQLTLTVNANSATVTAIQIDELGTGLDADTGSIYLYDDTDNDGLLDIPGDTLLNTQTFTGGTLTFSGFSVTVNAGTPENLLIVFDIASGAVVGRTLQLSLVSNTYVTVTAPDSVATTNFPINSNTVTITTVDTTPPEITEVSATPSSQTQGGYVNITVNADDDSGSVTVTVNITNPNGDTVDNATMTYDSSTGKHYYNAAYNIVGTYDFVIWASDPSSNWNSSSGNFAITALPTLVDIQVNVTDEDGNAISGATVKLMYTSNETLVDTQTTTTSGVATFDNIPVGSYTVEASKTDYQTTTGTVTVSEGDTGTKYVDIELPKAAAADLLWLWILIIIIIVVIILLLLWWLAKKKKGVEAEEPTPEKFEEMKPVEGEEAEVMPVAAAGASAAEATKTCVNCGREIKSEFNLCPFCGAKQESETGSSHSSTPAEETEVTLPREEETSEASGAKLSCKNCGKDLPPGFAFCPYCGATQ